MINSVGIIREQNAVRIASPLLHRFGERILVASGAKPSHAELVTKVLVAADLRGHYSHGVNRLEMYAKECRDGTVDVAAEPIVDSETVAVAMVDGANSHGPVVGQYAMDIACSKAKAVGIGFAVARRSNHYGIAGWYTMRASSQGLIGISMTNTSPLVFPTRSSQAALGTNPIAFSANGSTSNFVLDMATSTVALGKVEVAKRSNSNIPQGWGADANGHQTRSPQDVLQGGGLLPLGGVESSGGYKGYGLAMMVEMLCGVLGNAAYGPNIRSWRSSAETVTQANLGQCFMAIDPKFFGNGEESFRNRVSSFVDQVRGFPRTDDSSPILVAGDIEDANCAEQLTNGIRLNTKVFENLESLAVKYNIPIM